MAVQRHEYTVECANKFAGFDSDAHISSDDEFVMTNRPTATSKVVVVSPATTVTSPTNRFSARGGKARGGRGTGDRPRRGGYAARDEPSGGERRQRGPAINADGWGDSQSPTTERAFPADRESRRDPYPSRRPRTGARLFDKQTAGGRRGSREMKKSGGGGHNWGNEGVDFGAEEQDKSPTTPPAAATTDWASPKEEETPEVEADAVKPVEEVKAPSAEDKQPEEEVTIDLSEYKRQLRERRQNLPCYVKTAASTAELTTERDLQIEGYEKYVKEDEEEEEEEEEENPDKPKKKTLNVYEYMHNEGCRVRLFQRGGRGGRGRGGSSGQRGTSHKHMDASGRDAPNLEDTRAFPTLA
eukprot:GHVS01041560.1.p1 GENE.GHVS01041560.1~~GHVS01041560.1.p1  ORF type:complete len:356 (+),score=82.08 GHVS01041560.1:172-1239(+)